MKFSKRLSEIQLLADRRIDAGLKKLQTLNDWHTEVKKFSEMVSSPYSRSLMRQMAEWRARNKPLRVYIALQKMHEQVMHRTPPCDRRWLPKLPPIPKVSQTRWERFVFMTRVRDCKKKLRRL